MVTKYRCVDNDGWHSALTVGKIYDGHQATTLGYVTILCDNEGDEWTYVSRLFEEVVVEAVVPDGVSQQPHYKRFDIEPLVFITANNLPFWAGNVVKYVCRHDAKDGLKDIRKARDYLDKEIRRQEGEENWCR